MGWFGTGAGIGIGMALGGPIGAIIGGLIGSSIGERVGGASMGDAEKNQMIFITAWIAMLAKMAKADGVICQNEIAEISVLFDKAGLDAIDKKIAVNIFSTVKENQVTIYEYAQQYARIADREMCEIMYAALWEVARADGKIHPNEDIILKNITAYLQIPVSRYHQHQHQHQRQHQPKTYDNISSNIGECYEILGCTANDSDKTIKQKYKKAVTEYHPDKIHAKGLPKSFLDFANEQMKKINKAYDTINRHRKST